MSPLQIPRFVASPFWKIALAVLLLALLGGCKPAAPRPPGMMVAGITGYNFTSEGVQRYFVNDRYGSNLPPYGGGGATSCCASLPEQWQPDLTVKVDWTMGDWTVLYSKIANLPFDEQMQCCWRSRTLSKTVAVERYEAGGTLQVFFLADDQIRIYVSNYDLGHEKHPSGMTYPRNPDLQKEVP